MRRDIMKISYWIDFNCPYSYIGLTRLNKAIEELKLEDVKLDVHAYELDPSTSKEPITTDKFLLRKYNLGKNGIKEEIEKIEKIASEDNLTINYKSTPFSNSRDAHRIVKLAKQYNNQEMINSLVLKLFEEHFKNNVSLSDKEKLINISTKSGLNKDEIINVLESKQFDSEVILDERVAKDTGINGTPYFIFNNKYPIPGALPVSEFINVLKKVKFEEDIVKKYTSKQ